MNQKKIVLFGLNADPPHLGHLQVVQELERLLGQGTQFVIMPTGEHPFEKSKQQTSTIDLLWQDYSFRAIRRLWLVILKSISQIKLIPSKHFCILRVYIKTIDSILLWQLM